MATSEVDITVAPAPRRQPSVYQVPIPDRPIVETFRLLALNIQRLLGNEQRRSIAVMSAWPEDGRSLVAFSLARALSDLMPPVLLVDADPMGSGVNVVDPPARLNGNADHWLGEYPIEVVVNVPNLRVLVPPRNWARAPQAPMLFVRELNNATNIAMDQGLTVVIDTPACTASSIPFYMAGTATGVLYVARRRVQDGRTHRDIRAQLDMLGARILGVVFNEG
ncbi:MAG: hypothetical protein M3082_20285 [Candidatus Dormibacteraeota bacterium]|nr:hypothetical protein [Candidatus Dormibacteraeota bacterium]